jgi:hypothetical protein
MINQTKYACWEGGLTFSTIPPCPVTNSMENSDIILRYIIKAKTLYFKEYAIICQYSR